MSTEQGRGMTRRQALAATVAGAATIAGLSGIAVHDAEPVRAGTRRTGSRAPRLPVVFLPHGGGPWPFVELPFGSKTELDALATYLRSIRTLPNAAINAVLVISAHWEEPVPTVMSGAHPPMLYDYYGFPKEAYEITWPAPGHPHVAARVRQVLAAAGFETAANAERGFDHGTFVPLKLAYPNADVPTVQLSLKQGLDPAEHLAIGRALAPLRDEGVFIVGSGMTFHNLRAFGPQSQGVSEVFDRWLREACVLNQPARDEQLTKWLQAPAARTVHPREEHLLPLMVIAGAAGSDRGSVAYNGTLLDLRLSAYHFG